MCLSGADFENKNPKAKGVILNLFGAKLTKQSSLGRKSKRLTDINVILCAEVNSEIKINLQI